MVYIALPVQFSRIYHDHSRILNLSLRNCIFGFPVRVLFIVPRESVSSMGVFGLLFPIELVNYLACEGSN